MFPTANAMLFCLSTHKTGNISVKMSLAFQDMAQFEGFTGLNLLECVFNVIQNWEINALQFYLMMLDFFLSAVMVEGDESSRLRMAN